MSEIRTWLPKPLDVSAYRHAGVADYEAWHTSLGVGSFSTAALVADRLFATPFLAPLGMVLDRIAVNITAVSVGAARLGIYQDDPTKKVYPGKLVLDAGEIGTNVGGVNVININQPLAARTLNWLVLVTNATPTIRGHSTTKLINIIGQDNTLSLQTANGFYVAFPYAPLPLTFPAGPTLITIPPIPAIFVRLSS